MENNSLKIVVVIHAFLNVYKDIHCGIDKFLEHRGLENLPLTPSDLLSVSFAFAHSKTVTLSLLLLRSWHESPSRQYVSECRWHQKNPVSTAL